MKVFHSLDEMVGLYDRPVVAVGNFDGFHLGHKAIIEDALSLSLDSKSATIVITFEPHPQLVVGRRANFKILTTLDEKIRLLSQFPISATLVIPFTETFAQTEPEAFIQNVYIEKLQIRYLVVGFSHAFGRFGKGNTDLLKNVGTTTGFDVHVMPPLKIDDEIVNSSRIRKLLSEGKILESNSLLGHSYTLTGLVVHGEERGRKLNFPTANLSLDDPDLLLPKFGVYAVNAFVGGEWIQGVTNIGVRPTFGEGLVVCETHLLDFDKDIYGCPLQLEFVDRIRDEIKFTSVDSLIDQITNDIAQARRILTQI